MGFKRKLRRVWLREIKGITDISAYIMIFSAGMILLSCEDLYIAKMYICVLMLAFTLKSSLAMKYARVCRLYRLLAKAQERIVTRQLHIMEADLKLVKHIKDNHEEAKKHENGSHRKGSLSEG